MSSPFLSAPLPAEPAPLLDAKFIKPGTAVFQMKHQDNVVGTSRFDIQRQNGHWVLTETSVLEQYQVNAVNQTTLAADGLQPLAFRGTGTMFGRPVDIDVRWQDQKVTGKSLFPRAQGQPQGAIAIDREWPGGTLERTSVFFLVNAMPVAERKKWSFRWYNTYDDSLTEIDAAVTGSEEVTVPAGTFDTWRVELRGGQPSQVVYIAKQEPRQMVRIEVVDSPWTYERLPDGT